MFEFEVTIALITLIVLFSYMAEAVSIPYPIVLMLLGLGLGYIPGMPNIGIPRDVLLPLFLPPILFWAAILTNWHEFRRHWIAITSLGVLLVLVTSFLVAGVIYLLFPGLGFIPALLLGAIISPSDAVCATAILSRLGLSPRIISILEGESLINDASSIVLYNFALSMLLYHSSAFSHPVLNFFLMALGGVVLGIAIGWGFASMLHYLSAKKSFKKETSLPVIVSLIIPYLVFYVGTHLDVSNVLAVVSSGMTMRLMGDRKMDARARLKGTPVWDTFIFILNGLVFIMLGLEFPKVIKKTMSILPLGSLLELTVAVLACIIFVRIIWIYISARLLHSFESWKENLLIAWSGMRGIVSLALAMSIPTIIQEGNPSYHGDLILFVTREVILFVTVITILFTVIVQGLSLPWLVRKLNLENWATKNEHKVMDVFRDLTEVMIARVEVADFGSAENLQCTKKYLLHHYQNRLEYHHLRSLLSEKESTFKKKDLQRAILEYHRYEKTELRHLFSRGEINAEVFSRLMHYLDMEETKYLE